MVKPGRLKQKRFLFFLGVMLGASHLGYGDTPPMIEKYIAWRGGAAFTNLKTLSETGNFADGGLTGPGQVQSTSTGNARKTLNYGAFKTTITVAGDAGFYTNLAGQRLPLSPIEVGFAQSDATLLLPSAVVDRPVRRLASETIAGKTWNVVETNGNGGALYDFLIAPDTGALFGVRTRRNGSTEMELYSNWHVIDDVRLPFEVHDEGDAGLGAIQDDTTDLAIQKAVLNAPLTSNAFVPPPDRMVASFDPGQTSSGWIPFREIDHHIFLNIRVNGHQVQAILDSGAETTVVDTHYAASLGIHPSGNFLTEGEGGSAGVSYARHVEIVAGGLHLNDIAVGLIDLGLPGTQMKPPLVAVLGAEAFTQTAIDIDYPQSRLRFLLPHQIAALPNQVSLPLGTFEGSFSLPVSVEGRAPIQILVDTGNDGTFQLFPAYWRRLDREHKRRFSIVESGGVGGYADAKIVTLASLQFGSIRLKRVPASFELPGVDTNNETGLLGNCGNALLERFHVVFDFPEGQILLSPVANSFAPFPHDLVGLETIPDGAALKVFFVMPKSPAAAAGINVGDEITAIDGVPTKGGATPDDWENATLGEKVTLKFSDGLSKMIVKARFY